ncbi:DUF1667 domain-containing protein [Paludicola sp. MB14-C6]|uniref:DUF1667 domain-containing protein n=1 Tax=Paludihabitans sp. MB14-C6 TaxID=3070656 RepID=UPI0027DDF0CE|nr:DUF1667 domain-containing protein [Paludicola sp. MB14-C6]WMJ23775.1 DUF1667 domain-containing protein [Paludicola sp. MB14-C6]
MKELICIVCPKGCHLTIDDSLNVRGNSCEKGAVYAKEELTNPMRVVTSTVKIKGGIHNRLPVKTNAPIPKTMIMDAMKLLDHIELQSPISCGTVIVDNILGTGVHFVAARDM